jgi:hypothetical protein
MIRVCWSHSIVHNIDEVDTCWHERMCTVGRNSIRQQIIIFANKLKVKDDFFWAEIEVLAFYYIQIFSFYFYLSSVIMEVNGIDLCYKHLKKIIVSNSIPCYIWGFLLPVIGFFIGLAFCVCDLHCALVFLII